MLGLGNRNGLMGSSHNAVMLPSRPVPPATTSTFDQAIQKLRTLFNQEKVHTKPAIDRMKIVNGFDEKHRKLSTEYETEKRQLAAKLQANPKANTQAERNRLVKLKGDMTRVETSLRTLMTQQDAIAMQQDSNLMLQALYVGNEEIRRLQAENSAFKELDSDQIKDDFDEAIQDTVAQTEGLMNEFTSVDAIENFNAGLVAGGAAVADSIDDEIEALRAAALDDTEAQTDHDLLEIQAQLPALSAHAAAPPVRSGAGPVRPMAYMNPPATTVPSTSWAGATSSSATWKTVASSNPDDPDMAWLLGGS